MKEEEEIKKYKKRNILEKNDYNFIYVYVIKD